jgi:hypothetical protein
MSAYILKGTKNRLPSARYYTIPLLRFAAGLDFEKGKRRVFSLKPSITMKPRPEEIDSEIANPEDKSQSSR